MEPSQHLIVDKMKNEMFLYEQGRLVERFNVATGRRPDMTPEGRFYVVSKSLVPNEPEQRHLFGTRWMGLGVPGGEKGDVYGIHGTGQPGTLGGHESAGCIRMGIRDAERLYNRVREGDTVIYIMSHRYSILIHRAMNPAY
jgi:lipoprotein-anchoring transpeptidase ErfK/SrfK